MNIKFNSTGLKKHHCNLPNVEVYVMLRLMGYE